MFKKLLIVKKTPHQAIHQINFKHYVLYKKLFFS